MDASMRMLAVASFCFLQLSCYAYPSSNRFLTAIHRNSFAAKDGDTICSKEKCGDGKTCCQSGSDMYGCCDMDNAVCCGDGVSCCPAETVCNLKTGTCDQEITFAQITASKVSEIIRAVVCPGGQSECPTGSTCCLLGTGQYGCCPLENAVCCSDKLHCCPHGYTCDPTGGSCLKQNSVVPWYEKVAATRRAVDSVICPGGQSYCPDGTTCCIQSSGQYGCCPLPNAVCCSDKTHCCPSGYTCNTGAGTCVRAGSEIQAMTGLTTSKVNAVICPDGRSQCPDGTTCCSLGSGQYGCCPLPKAVCCSDHSHCCPEGYKCDTAGGTCTKGDSVMSWYEKIVAKPVDSVICPGGQSYCPDGTTCCIQSSGEYGCCPLPNAVCCSDKTHCCPSGYTCNTGAGTCVKASSDIQAMTGLAISKANAVICPDGRSQCPDGTTCCLLGSGQYGCCPLPKAVCCSDHSHCCPEGYKCDTAGGTCTKGDSVMSWFEKTVATKASTVICPDGRSQCPDGTTCCTLGSGQYGCCPLPKAVCCSDDTHCCPEGYKCDTAGGTCTKGDSVMSWFAKTVATTVDNVVCPGGQSYCPDGNTCCIQSSGQYGCCPLPNAVCCSDRTHCCPSGYTCNTGAGTCVKASSEVQAMTGLTISGVHVVICPDGRSQCPDGTTCCSLGSGQYGCCPLPKAVCCSDHSHCCPEGYKCDTAGGTCTKGDSVMLWFEKTEATKANAVICPDGRSQCPDGTTCCRLGSGQYGCCPLPKAVCCSDHTHCCPEGYKCDTASGTCTKGDSVMSWLEKTVATTVDNVVCPGGQSYCPDGTTCCIQSSGQYGCCPLPNAVCCSDRTHCCPSGYNCNTGAGTCVRASSEVQAMTGLTISAVDNVVCPGGQSYCPDGNTSCIQSSGQYGCCPLPNAVCCSDRTHCCPSGYTCNTGAGTCVRASSEVQAMTGLTISGVHVVICPDGRSQCPDGTTCCSLGSGQYGCCPLPHAVCCSDHSHCCPQGYKCDTAGGTCTNGDSVISWFEKTAVTKVNAVICPDGRSQCPDGTTCCSLGSGQYGCCPLPKAVCCSDHTHCCPEGYKCDTAGGTCTKGDSVMSWFQKTDATKASAVVCPDGRSQCPDGTTCCSLGSGQYGCCPVPKAVCCSDHTHCCPEGYKCDTAGGTCTKGDSVMSWFKKNVATTVDNVICPGGQSYCPDGNTCCIQSSGEYGCCPLPNAVCCSDKTHCCPSGYTCNTGAGTCVRASSEVQAMTGLTISGVHVVICPDGRSQCPDGTTCCSLGSGQYGCCPLPHAVCCSDHSHCCPQGYKCDTAGGTCTNGDSVISWFEKTAVTKVNAVICPDGRSQCPDGTTCCSLGSGQYGCCPLPKAVCCSDHSHCCPEGYKCDTAGGTCTKGDSVMSWFEKTVATTVDNVVCPGGQSYCPDGTTCCIQSSGQYGCCPLPNAVCCSDKTHCCPSGYTCNTGAGTCVRASSEVQAMTRLTISGVHVVICPDGRSQCPDGTTCCSLGSGKYGCCPLPNAVCCSDHSHCCPQGYKCDTVGGTCTKGDSIISWFEKTAVTKVNAVICPDGRSQCPDGTTCCSLGSGQYGCCPLPKAVCCSDHSHCCPEGYKCDTAGGTCTKGDSVMSWFEKTEATTVISEPLHELNTQAQSNSGDRDHCVMCPDDTECPNFNTCCQLSSGKYGCCPFPQAVCCPDHQHCCKHGFVCDTAHSLCVSSDDDSQHPMMRMQFFEKTFSIESDVMTFDEM